MKKSQLLDIVCALILFAMNSSAFAAIIASDDTAIASTGQAYAQTLVASSSSSFSDGALILDVLGDSGQTEVDENFGYFIDGTLPVARPLRADSHASLWLLLIAAAVAGTLSEIFHRRSVNR